MLPYETVLLPGYLHGVQMCCGQIGVPLELMEWANTLSEASDATFTVGTLPFRIQSQILAIWLVHNCIFLTSKVSIMSYPFSN